MIVAAMPRPMQSWTRWASTLVSPGGAWIEGAGVRPVPH